MRNLIFILAGLIIITSCKKDGNDCIETCVNGTCNELLNECECNEGWVGKDCDVSVQTFEKTIPVPERTDENGNNYEFRSIGNIELTNDFGFIITYQRSNNKGDHHFLCVMKISNTGEVQWDILLEDYLTYGASKEILQTNDGYYVSYGNQLNKIDEDGNLIWHKDYGYSQIHKMKVNNEGHLILVGKEYPIGLRSIWTALTDMNGNLIWESDLFDTSYFGVNGLVCVEDGYILMGSTWAHRNNTLSNGFIDVLLLKIDLDGNHLWSKNYGGSSIDEGRSIIKTNKSDYLIAGFSTSSDIDIDNNYGRSDAMVLKVDSAENILWVKNYGGSDWDQFDIIQSNNDENYVLGGTTSSSDFDVDFNNNGSDFWLVKIAPTGDLIWEKTYGTDKDEDLNDMKITLDGGYIMIGLSDDKDIYLVKTDGTGNL